jgi:creatinine amidohydrolase/Fe(II)-dependent formamide hydrolase-like protein
MVGGLHDVTAVALAAKRSSESTRRGVILPIGSVEQHGPCLPVTCDLDIAIGAAAELHRALEVTAGYRTCVAPAIPYGPVPGASHTDGTCDVSFSAFGDYVRAVTAGFATSGTWDFLVLVNAHAHNHGRVIEAGIAVRRDHGVPAFVVQLYEYAPLGAEFGLEPGTHAGEFELALHAYYTGRQAPGAHPPPHTGAQPRPRPGSVFGLDVMPRSIDGVIAPSLPSQERAFAAAPALGRRLDAELASQLLDDLDTYFAYWSKGHGHQPGAP